MHALRHYLHVVCYALNIDALPSAHAFLLVYVCGTYTRVNSICIIVRIRIPDMVLPSWCLTN